MARERTVKDTPKRGKLTKRQVQRAVEKVVYARRGGGEAMSSSSTRQTHQASHTIIKVGRDVRTGRFISCKEAERRKATAVVETIKRPEKKKIECVLRNQENYKSTVPQTGESLSPNG